MNGEKTELDILLEQLGVNDEWKVENIKEVAMNRHSVKKSKRKFVKVVLDEAFNLLKRVKQ